MPLRNACLSLAPDFGVRSEGYGIASPRKATASVDDRAVAGLRRGCAQGMIPLPRRPPTWPECGATVPVSVPHSGNWSAPTLAYLTIRPDPISATALRRADPDWALRVSRRGLRDEVTHQLIAFEETVTR